jgi:hypothetical protein
MNRVVYRGEHYYCKLPVRESLFPDLRRTRPDYEVRIKNIYNGIERVVKIGDLKMYSET